MEKAVVLLSGGIDSTTCLGVAIDKHGKDNVLALSLTYGQKHAKELNCAKAVAEHYGVRFHSMDLSSVFVFSDCPLLQGREEMEHGSYAEQIAKNGEGTVATYVPFRNGLMLSTAAAIALSVDASIIYYGAHADDAAGRAYPDCTPEFEEAMNEAIYAGSGDKVRMEAPLIEMNKTDVVKLGLSLNVPYELTWSCYEGRDKQCGTCGTCIDRRKAFLNNGIEDPVEYSDLAEVIECKSVEE